MHQETKLKSLKSLGFVSILISIVFWLFFFLIKETDSQDLISIEGEFVISRQVQIVKKSKIGSNKSTVITLVSYPNNEFNLGETFEYENLIMEIEKAEKPINVGLTISKNFFDLERSIIPAFYGFWINGKEIKSNEQGFQSNKRNRRIMPIVGSIFSLAGLVLVSIGMKKVPNKTYEWMGYDQLRNFGSTWKVRHLL